MKESKRPEIALKSSTLVKTSSADVIITNDAAARRDVTYESSCDVKQSSGDVTRSSDRERVSVVSDDYHDASCSSSASRKSLPQAPIESPSSSTAPIVSPSSSSGSSRYSIISHSTSNQSSPSSPKLARSAPITDQQMSAPITDHHRFPPITDQHASSAAKQCSSPPPMTAVSHKPHKHDLSHKSRLPVSCTPKRPPAVATRTSPPVPPPRSPLSVRRVPASPQRSPVLQRAAPPPPRSPVLQRAAPSPQRSPVLQRALGPKVYRRDVKVQRDQVTTSSPGQPGPSKSGPSKSGPSKPGPSKPAPSKSGPSKSGPSKPGPSKPASSKPGQKTVTGVKDTALWAPAKNGKPRLQRSQTQECRRTRLNTRQASMESPSTNLVVRPSSTGKMAATIRETELILPCRSGDEGSDVSAASSLSDEIFQALQKSFDDQCQQVLQGYQPDHVTDHRRSRTLDQISLSDSCCGSFSSVDEAGETRL